MLLYWWIIYIVFNDRLARKWSFCLVKHSEPKIESFLSKHKKRTTKQKGKPFFRKRWSHNKEYSKWVGTSWQKKRVGTRYWYRELREHNNWKEYVLGYESNFFINRTANRSHQGWPLRDDIVALPRASFTFPNSL